MLVINGRFLSKDFPTGTHRSSYFLMTKICERLTQYEILCPRTPQMELPDWLLERVRVVNPLSLPAHIWEQFWLPRQHRGSTHLNLIGTSAFLTLPSSTAMVVHDVNYDLSPSSFDWRFRIWYRLACSHAAVKADQVFAVSEYTKQTLVKRTRVNPDKVTVFRQGPGLPLEFLTNGVREAPTTPFILCVGSLQPHKNLAGILAAFDIFKRSHYAPCNLRVVGKKQKYFNDPNIDSSLLDRNDVEFTGYLSDEELGKLYQQAAMFVYPSFEEGFGMPLVEAFYAGCPVITSDQSCLPEIAGDAACLVSPHDHEAIAAAMDKLATDESFRNDKIQRGHERARLYSWDGAAETVLEKLRALSDGQLM